MEGGIKTAGFRILLLALLCVLLVLYVEIKDNKGIGEYKPELSVTFFDVGKGDCILIEAGGSYAMIDTGYDEDGGRIAQYLKERQIDKLQYLILTHPDKDHIGGADLILEQIAADEIIESTCGEDSRDYVEYQEMARDKAILLTALAEEKTLELGPAKLVIYPSVQTIYEGENNASLAVTLQYGKTRFLFTGDAGEERIEELLIQIPDMKSQVLKVPHHGRMKANAERLIEAVQPDIAVITSEKEKMYKEMEALLKEKGADVYVTKKGSVTLQSDGSRITVIQ